MHQKLNINRKRYGTIRFLFSSGAANSQKEAHRNAGNNTSSDHDNYDRGYEDGYDDCCSNHDCSYNAYHDSSYFNRDEYDGCENDGAVTVIVTGSQLLKMDYSHYYIIKK